MSLMAGAGGPIPGSDGLDPIGFLGPSPRLILASPTHSLDPLKGNTPSPRWGNGRILPLSMMYLVRELPSQSRLTFEATFLDASGLGLYRKGTAVTIAGKVIFSENPTRLLQCDGARRQRSNVARRLRGFQLTLKR